MSRILPPPPSSQSGTELSRYRLLAPSAGGMTYLLNRHLKDSVFVRVSPLCLGAMSLGKAWEQSMAGGTTEDETFKFLDVFWENGGNFIDTANNYQSQESEKLVGAWAKARGIRDQLVIATKYTIGYKNDEADVKLKVNYQGNHRKSLVLSVQDSLTKLQTSYIDLLYLHLWDYSTSIPEVMQALDSLVKANKVLYLGISDTPAWLVVKANEYARAHGMAQFVVYQGLWSLTVRDLEREILPMCRAEGMGIAPWGVLGQGKFKNEAEIKARSAIRFNTPQSAVEKSVSAVLEKVANEVGNGATLGSIAVAWAMNKAPYVFPIVGGRSRQQLEEVIKGLEIVLTADQIKSLEGAAPFEFGFPYLQLFGTDPALGDGRPGYFVAAAGPVKYVKASAPIIPGP